MKSNILIFIIAVGVMFVTSCSEVKFGDEFLGDSPERLGATLDTMFSSAVHSDKVLTTAYLNLPYGTKRSYTTDIYTDLAIKTGANPYYNGAIDPTVSKNDLLYAAGGESDWKAIRYAWLYIEHIDKVKDMDNSEKARRVAEAKTIIALCYGRMLRNVGGVPLIKKSIGLDDAFTFPRTSFAETVDYIVTLLDEAVEDLPWKSTANDDGRMTKAGAMGLKLRVLLFAASPTFNSTTPWHAKANKYTRYVDGDVMGKWRRAVSAGEAFMSALQENGEYMLTQPTEETHEARRLAFRKAYYERGGTEILISTRRSFNKPVFEGGMRYYFGPTLNYIDMFPWADGTEFPDDYDWSSSTQSPFYDKDHRPTRDPRLYETAAVPGSYHYNGTIAPVYLGHPDYRKGSSTGFRTMKFILESYEDRAGKGTQFPYLRLPEVFLSYAEALNEVEGGPNEKAYDFINRVRNRVGLSDLPKGLSQESFRKALLKERALEFGFENVRWYDLIRRGMASDFTKDLNILISTVTKKENNVPVSFRFEAIKWNPNRYWKEHWDTKWYLSPIPRLELNKGYGWIQNPGW
ncbi:RagB/SusD family nutrient uptake outer membrane protein [Halosquirtibacter xylanolyticus]|uniref:RagB/SusD family nutrient uptake outer membrane protein n=1 Tax=Halosquirtibacter xylanolyticus TaxID=3374599 RepID=UPI003748B0EE|nr:RagB/SusD family nutrient uptake outer membrane protein [Prolixibacteraceae bacterium]